MIRPLSRPRRGPATSAARASTLALTPSLTRAAAWLAALLACCAGAPTPAALAAPAGPNVSQEILGTWVLQDPRGGRSLTIAFNADGSAKFGDKSVRFEARVYSNGPSELTVQLDEGPIHYAFSFPSADELQISGGDLKEAATFVRQAVARRGGLGGLIDAPATPPTTGPATTAPATAGPPADGPKGVVLAFLQHLQKGDAAAAQALCVGDAERMNMLKDLAELQGAEAGLRRAMAEQFAGRAEEAARDRFPQDPARLLADARESIEGDRARLTDANDHDALWLRKVGGAWRVDLNTKDFDPRHADEFHRQARLNRDLAAEVRAGKYPSADAVRDAMFRRFEEEWEARRKPAEEKARPATPGAATTGPSTGAATRETPPLPPADGGAGNVPPAEIRR